jgi:hypothetical protein
VSTTDDDSHRATESNQAPAQPDVPRCGPGGRVAHPQGQFGPDLDSLRPPGVGRESQGRRRIDGIDGRDSARHRHRIRRGRRRGLRSPGRRPLMGAVACATLEVSLGGRVDFSASARPRLARPLGRQDRRARVSPAPAGRPRDRMPRRTCDHGPGSDASSTGDDTPSATAVERVLWARRHREARPPGARVAGSNVTGATPPLAMSWWSRPLGHSLGHTPPYWAVPGPMPGTERHG